MLTCLPEAQREVIVLAFYGELTHTEIAAELDVPIGTVKGRMRLGLPRSAAPRDLRAWADQRRPAIVWEFAEAGLTRQSARPTASLAPLGGWEAR